MTDEELIARLRQEGYDHFGRTSANLAANRIEALIDERDEQIEWVKRLADDLIAAEAKLAKAVDALQLVTDACDEGVMVSMGATIYNSVPAWPIEEARAILTEINGETT